MRPIRGEQKQHLAGNPWEKREQQLHEEEVVHLVSDNGGIESYRTGRQFANACGCLKPAGGFCAVCSIENSFRPICVDCFGFCMKCHKPLCPRHSTFLKSTEGGDIRLCGECEESTRRRQVISRVFRFLLVPFVKFPEDHHEQR